MPHTDRCPYGTTENVTPSCSVHPAEPITYNPITFRVKSYDTVRAAVSKLTTMAYVCVCAYISV